jgi:dTMP kinase
MQRGLYVIFEGMDGTGKTSTMEKVAEQLKARTYGYLDNTKFHLTHHPGSTALGKHMRQLVKYPEQIDPDIKMDDLSRQMLYMVDTVAFIKSLLIPALDKNEIVFADRSSFISALVYGTADGLSVDEVARLFNIITPPKADRVFILHCPWEVGKKRVSGSRENLDYYDRKNGEYYRRIQDTYDNLVTGPADRTIAISTCVAIDDIEYVDANVEQDKVVSAIVDDLLRLISERERVSFDEK